MFSLISKLKIHPRRSITTNLKNNIFIASIRQMAYIWSNNCMSTKLKLTTLPAFEHCQMSPYYVSKRNAPGPRVPHIKPPVQEPNTPKSKVKKDKRKEEEKIKKPALYAKEKITNISQADQRAVEEMQNILRRKWGVKLSKDVALHNSDETVAAPAEKLMEEQKSIERVLQDIMNKTDVELENYQIKRTRGNTFKMEKISVLQTTEPDKTTSIVNQYNIPAEVKEGEEANVWKNAAVESTSRSIEKEPTPKELQVSESIFIRPEPPKPKSDEKSVKTP